MLTAANGGPKPKRIPEIDAAVEEFRKTTVERYGPFDGVRSIYFANLLLALEALLRSMRAVSNAGMHRGTALVERLEARSREFDRLCARLGFSEVDFRGVPSAKERYRKR